MLRLHIIRHGETDYNKKGIVQGGGIDSDLNDTGRKQSQLFFEKYSDHPFEGYFCSGLKRTYQTIEPFVHAGHSVTKVPELNEFNWGVLEGQPGSEAIRAEFAKMNTLWQDGQLDVRIEGGESPVEAWNRLESGLEAIRLQHPEGGDVLVCTHGRVLRIILAQILGYGLTEMNRFSHDNTGLNLVTRYTNGKWFAEKLNDLSHLNA